MIKKSYTFNEKNEYSKEGTKIIIKYLLSLKNTVKVLNVENIKEYQQQDIDIIWAYTLDGEEISIAIEVKTDRYMTGNFWLETKSNETLNTPGCFIKSQAAYFYYYFPGWDRLYIMPLKESRKWFLEHINEFEESKTSTKDEKGAYQHTTVGRKVPIKIMKEAVKNIRVVEQVSKKI